MSDYYFVDQFGDLIYVGVTGIITVCDCVMLMYFGELIICASCGF